MQPAIGIVTLIVIVVMLFWWDIRKMTKKMAKEEANKIEPMSSSEYQQFYDAGLMPERFWPREEAKLRKQYANDEITLQELDDSLDDMMRPYNLRRR